MPAARDFIRANKLNETLPGGLEDIGVIVMGGLTNSRAARARTHGTR